jgi:hypothetical protein
MNWTYLGFALSSSKLDDDALKEVIGDLSHLARLKAGSDLKAQRR